MFTFDGERVRTSQTFIFDTNVGPLGSIYMDPNSNTVISAARALYLRGNNDVKIRLDNYVNPSVWLLMGRNRISDLQAPLVDWDAATKKYAYDKRAELTAGNLNMNGNNIIGLPTVSTAINDNSAAVSWGVLLETLNAMYANLVHKAGDTMMGQLNAETVVVDGKLSDGSTAGWSLSVNNGYL
jgi:hypothetical protein